MGYCVECKYEFETSELICPSCKDLLVPVLSGKETAAVNPDSNWVVVGGVKDSMIGELALDSLDSSNIPSVFLPALTKEELDKLVKKNIPINNPEGNLIMVPREFKFEATLVLSDFLGEELNIDEKNNHWL